MSADHMDPNLVILAGGVSSRMRKPVAGSSIVDRTLLQEAREISKSMIGVGEGHRPLMDYLLCNAQKAGYRDVVIVVGENDRSFRDHYGTADAGNQFHELTISYVVQPIPSGKTKPLGTADALLHALRMRKDWNNKKFTVCNSDNIYSRNALRLLLEDDHESAMIDYDRDALQFEQSRIEQFAVIRKNREGYLKAIIEKPTLDEISAVTDAGNRVGVSMNIFRFSYKSVFSILERVPIHSVRQEKELPRAIMMMLEENPQAMMTIPLAEYVPDLTHPDDIVRVQEYLRKEFPHFSI